MKLMSQRICCKRTCFRGGCSWSRKPKMWFTELEPSTRAFRIKRTRRRTRARIRRRAAKEAREARAARAEPRSPLPLVEGRNQKLQSAARLRQAVGARETPAGISRAKRQDTFH